MTRAKAPSKLAARARKSAASPRVGKPRPARTEPIRNFSKIFGTSGAAKKPTPDARKTSGKPTNGKPAKGRKANGKGARREPHNTGDVAHGVGVAYSVIGDYLEQGRKVAEKVMPSPEAAGNLARELPQMTERMFRYASDFASVWLDAMGLVAAGATRRDGNGSADPTSAGPWTAPLDPRAQRAPRPAAVDARPSALTPIVRVVVTAKKPLSVTVQLAAGVGGAPLEAEGVFDAGGSRKKPGVAVEASVFPGRVEVRVTAAARPAAGSRAGKLVDVRDQREIGTFVVDVGS